MDVKSNYRNSVDQKPTRSVGRNFVTSTSTSTQKDGKTDKHVVRFSGLHNPPKRPHPIPCVVVKGFVRYSDDEDWEPEVKEEEVVVSSEDDETPLIDFNCTIRPKVPETWVDLEKEDGIKRDVVRGWISADFEPIKMVNLNMQEVKTHPHFRMKKNSFYSVRLEKVVSPTDFFLEFILHPPTDGCATWEESLQRFYNNSVNAKKYQMRTLKPFSNQHYAFYNEDSKKWERIRVHEIICKNQSVVAFHLDRIEIVRDVPFTSLFELHTDYANWHRYPIKGDLLDCFPKNPPGQDQRKWSDEACEFFRNFVKDKTFWAFISNMTPPVATIEGIMQTRSEDRFMGVTVVLFEKGKSQPPVNAWLVQKGYAYAEDIMSTSIEQMGFCHKLKLQIEDPYKKTLTGTGTGTLPR
ncbi:unnamed protein product [Orchesella dallaii]|uniref:Uncharacterized protein n=1 Tax=Orchesella dallaii TaxID=48710 RepID=A0ABP1Q3P8_9HEXA